MSIEIKSIHPVDLKQEHQLFNTLHEIEQLAPYGSDIILSIDDVIRLDIQSNHVSFVAISNNSDPLAAIQELQKNILDQISNWKKSRFDRDYDNDPVDVSDDFLKK